MSVSSSFRQIARVAFALAVILLATGAVVAYRTTNSLVNSEKLVAHTHEVQALMEDLRADIIGAEYSRRGFTITNDEALLKDYQSALQEIPAEMAHLRQLTLDNPQRKTKFDDLQTLIDHNLLLQRGSVESRRKGQPNLEQESLITRETAQLTNQTNAIIRSLENDENRLLAERRAASASLYKRTLYALGLAFLIALALLVAEFSLLNVEFSRHERTERSARQTRELVNAFFSCSTVGFGILDPELRYRRVNAVLANIAGAKPETLTGKSVNEIFGESGIHTDAVFRSVIRSGQPILDYELSGKSAGQPGKTHHWLVNYFPIRDNREGVTEVGVIAVDVTERRNAEDAIRRLSARFLSLQDQERRRIAREIHDSLGQYLAALKISIDMLSNPAGPKTENLLAECSELVGQCITESRTISHLLHPPLLDEAGFASAASWFVAGFSQRSGIPVTLDIPPDLPRMPNAVELALFRVLQEGLTNVHRHAESKSAEIRLKVAAAQVTLQIRDHGRGIDPHLLQQIETDGSRSGIGLAGMRERVHELGGAFEIDSDRQGTVISVAIPLPSQPSQVIAVGGETGKGQPAA